MLLGTIPEIRNQILADVVRDDKDTLNVTLACRQLFHERFTDRDDAVERERVRNVTVNYIADHRARHQRAADLEAAADRGPA